MIDFAYKLQLIFLKLRDLSVSVFEEIIKFFKLLGQECNLILIIF